VVVEELPSIVAIKTQDLKGQDLFDFRDALLHSMLAPF